MRIEGRHSAPFPTAGGTGNFPGATDGLPANADPQAPSDTGGQAARGIRPSGPGPRVTPTLLAASSDPANARTSDSTRSCHAPRQHPPLLGDPCVGRRYIAGPFHGGPGPGSLSYPAARPAAHRDAPAMLRATASATLIPSTAAERMPPA